MILYRKKIRKGEFAMNKKEIAEVRKQFSPINCNITRVASCCITAEKELISQKTEAFLSLAEEKAMQYFSLFKDALSGKVGERLHTLNFPVVDGGSKAWRMMEDLRKSRLEDETLTEEFFKVVKDTYHYNDNYMVILVHGLYDIPCQTNDDGSVYEYIDCIICPVELSKAALAYDRAENAIMDCIRQKLLGKPETGILYPAFHDRSEDINALLYYDKKGSDRQDDLVFAITEAEMPYTNVEIKNRFTTAAENIETPFTLDTAKALSDIVTDAEGSEAGITAKELSEALESRGIDPEACGMLKLALDATIGKDTKIPISVLGDSKKSVIETPEMKVIAETDYIQQVKAVRLDGRLCLVYPVSDRNARINGVTTVLQ